MKNILVIVVLCLTVTGCVTAYQPEGFGGGFREQQISADTYIVSARGNAFASMDRIQAISLRRAAELTIQNGYKFFQVIDGHQDYKTGVITSPGTYTGTTTGAAYSYGGNAYGSATTYGTYTPGYTSTYKKPRASITVEMTNDPNDGAPGFHNAADVLKYTSNLVE